MLSTQIIVSFLTGGLLLSLLTLFAERAGGKVAGILLMFPSTIVLGFLFLGLSTSAQTVADVAPATLFPLGIVVASSLVYIRVAMISVRLFPSRLMQLAFTLLISTLAWFLLAAPFAIFQISNLFAGVLGYAFMAGLTFYLYNRMKPLDEPPARVRYTRLQLVLRAVFMGSTIAVVVWAGKNVSPFWGGVLTMYPVATFSTLMVLHTYHEPMTLTHFYRHSAVGSLSLFSYCICTMTLFPSLGVATGTVCACAVSIFISILLSRINLA